MHTNRFGITFYKPNKSTKKLDFIPDSEVDFSKQYFLVTSDKWLTIFERNKASKVDWKKTYVYCPNNPEAINELYARFPAIKIIEIVKLVTFKNKDNKKVKGFTSVFCSCFDFEFPDRGTNFSKLLQDTFIQPPFTKDQILNWLKTAPSPNRRDISLRDLEFNWVME